MNTFYFVVRKHNSFNGKNRARTYSGQDYLKALKHYCRLIGLKDIDRASLRLRCGMTQPYDEVVLEEYQQ